MKELSNFSNSNMKPLNSQTCITSATTQQPKINTNQLSNTTLINAKIGKNNVKSRRDSNDALNAISTTMSHNNLKGGDKKDN